jgi:hypothetical protein
MPTRNGTNMLKLTEPLLAVQRSLRLAALKLRRLPLSAARRAAAQARRGPPARSGEPRTNLGRSARTSGLHIAGREADE